MGGGEDSRDVHPETRAHRGGDGQGPQVLALRAAGLGAVDRIHQGRQVLDQLLFAEARLADGHVDDGALVDLELDAACLDLLDRALEVERDGARLRVRHQAAPAEDPSQLADHAHDVRRREGDVELEPAGFDLLDQVLGADLVRTGTERLEGLLALGEDGDADDLARPVRQDDRAADHLVGVAGVDAQAQVRLDGCVELDVRCLLRDRDRLRHGVDPGAVDELRGVLVALPVLGHVRAPSVSRTCPWWFARGPGSLPCTPPALADDLDAHAPGGSLDDLHAGLDVVRVEVGHLLLGDLADLVAGHASGHRALRGRGAGGDPGGLAEEVGRRRGLEDERERAILEDRDLGRDDLARLVGGPLVVGLGELDDVDAVRPQRGADGRGGCRLAGRQLQRQDDSDLLGHVCSLPASLQLLDLEEVELDRRLPAEDAHEDLHLVALRVDLVHGPDEFRERPVQ